ncbi:hypothetical protein [Alistipes ihumii]|uniref:hypothetical protein n=1 Tax=Alistipes ihumii TaxID=1470347 RepID=UPI003AB53B0F
MKTIYLQVLGEGWVSFQYTNISELEEEFAQRGIEVGNGCKLGYGCKLGDDCELGECCKLGYGCKVPKSLFISASQHSVSYWGYDAIQIGCKKYTISEWQKHFREIGKAEGYSEEQIDEYGSYIDLIAKLHGRWNIKQK